MLPDPSRLSPAIYDRMDIRRVRPDLIINRKDALTEGDESHQMAARERPRSFRGNQCRTRGKSENENRVPALLFYKTESLLQGRLEPCRGFRSHSAVFVRSMS